MKQLDIENCGWIPCLVYKNKYAIQSNDDTYIMWHDSIRNKCLISYHISGVDAELTVFKGKVNNASELKEIMQMTEIMNTIKNNDPDTTFYSLSITELIELGWQFHDNVENEDMNAPSSFIEAYVDYMKNNRKDK